MVGTEGGVWVLSEILLEASLCLCQEVQEYPCLLICLLGSPSVYYLCQSMCMCLGCKVFSFARVLLFMCMCLFEGFTRKIFFFYLLCLIYDMHDI